MGLASGVDHTFTYGMKKFEIYSGRRSYFEGEVIYAENLLRGSGLAIQCNGLQMK